MNEIFGYKSFNNKWENINGKKLETGKKYHIDGDIKFGVNGNGYHFAARLEDTLRYQISNGILNDPPIAQVLGTGTIVESYDEYYGYYDLYATSDIEILKYLTRDEIIDYALKLSGPRLERFITQYKLNDDEIKLFKGKDLFLDLAILCYQKKIKNTYELFYSSDRDKVMKLVKNL